MFTAAQPLYRPAHNSSEPVLCGGEMEEETGRECNTMGRGKVHTGFGGVGGDLGKWSHLEYPGVDVSVLLKFM